MFPVCNENLFKFNCQKISSFVKGLGFIGYLLGFYCGGKPVQHIYMAYGRLYLKGNRKLKVVGCNGGGN